MLYRYYSDLAGEDYEWGYAGSSAAGLIPTNDHRTCVFVGTTPARMHALRRTGVEDAFAALVASAAPAFVERVGVALPVGRIRGWAGVPGYVRRSYGPGWVLVGDAGYFKDPITAHGITDALRDADLVADQIVESLSGGVPEALAMGRYRATRDRLSERLFEATELVAGYDWDAERVQGLVRRVSAAMTDEVEYLEERPDARSDRAVAALPRPDSAPVGS
jgi:flavin-dependent dehydrogenase